MEEGTPYFDAEKIQKQIDDIRYKREAKFAALKAVVGINAYSVAESNIIDAEKIYQWLIKDVS